MAVTQSSFQSQKLSYAKRLIKKAEAVKFSAPLLDKLTAWNKAIDYCEKWERYFEKGAKPKMTALLEKSEKGKKLALDWDEWKLEQAVKEQNRIKEVKKTCRELGLTYA